MKKLAFLLCIAFIVMGAFVTRDRTKSGIHGIIEPADGAKKVTAIMGTDSVSTIPVSGKFSLEVKPGTWTLADEKEDVKKYY